MELVFRAISSLGRSRPGLDDDRIMPIRSGSLHLKPIPLQKYKFLDLNQIDEDLKAWSG